MKWIKKGHVFSPSGEHAWAQRYGYSPTPHFVNRHTLRLYVACTDENTVGRIGFVDVDPDNPTKILDVSQDPVFDIGTPGAFDDNGVVPTQVLEVDEQLYLYYTGFQLGHKVRYFTFSGLAISEDGGYTFNRYSKAPIIDRSDKELLNRTGVFVMRENDLFKMWYSGGSEWIHAYGKMRPVYDLRYLESDDGKTWGDEGRVCLDFRNDDEYGFGKPWVLKDGTIYKMFYSTRSKSRGYRLGYAESKDGLDWTRKDDEVGLDVSESGWDSEMVEYPSIVSYKGKVYMFYCGNNLGETGFGCAVLKHW